MAEEFHPELGAITVNTDERPVQHLLLSVAWTSDYPRKVREENIDIFEKIDEMAANAE